MRKITDWLKAEGIPGFGSESKSKMAIATVGYVLFLAIVVTAIFAPHIPTVDQTTDPTTMPVLPHKKPIPTPSPLPTTTPTPTPAQEVTLTTPSPTPLPTPTLLRRGFDEWYAVDGLKVCVRDVKRFNSIELENFKNNETETIYPEDDDHRFLAVSIIVKNDGNTLVDAPSADAYILDLENKAQYESTTPREGSYYTGLGPAYRGDIELFPGIEEKRIILIKIPKEAKKDLRFVLRVSSGYIQWAI